VATTVPFDWRATPSGSDAGHWPLTWELLGEQLARLALEEIVPRDRFDDEGTFWAPAVDLDLSGVNVRTWFEEDQFVPARQIWGIASAGSQARLLPGSILRLESVREDRYWEGMGTNFWSIDEPGLGVVYLHSALEGRWGGPAVLADALLVPADHPFLGDAERAERLVRDLQSITRQFRAAHGLPANGNGDG
jgi:hypothetical protein